MIPTLPNGEPRQGQTPTDRTRSAKESLGLSSQSGLLNASILAGIGFAIVFAVLTFVPYFWDKAQAAKKDSTPAPAEKAGPPVAGQPAVAPAPSTPDSAGKLSPAGAAAVGKQPAKGDIVDKLGENATKTAPAKVNPLDKKDDDILKDFKP